MSTTTCDTSTLYREIASSCLEKQLDTFPLFRKELLDEGTYSKIDAFAECGSTISAAFLALNKCLQELGFGLSDDVAEVASQTILRRDSVLLDDTRKAIDQNRLEDAEDAAAEAAGIACAMLLAVHDFRVREFADDFNKQEGIEAKLRYYPAPLIGFKLFYENNIFVEPILFFVGLKASKEDVKKKYDRLQEEYLRSHAISNSAALERHLRTLQYPAAPESILTVIRHYRSTDSESMMPRIIRGIEQRSQLPWLVCKRA